MPPLYPCPPGHLFSLRKRLVSKQVPCVMRTCLHGAARTRRPDLPAACSSLLPPVHHRPRSSTRPAPRTNARQSEEAQERQTGQPRCFAGRVLLRHAEGSERRSRPLVVLTPLPPCRLRSLPLPAPCRLRPENRLICRRQARRPSPRPSLASSNSSSRRPDAKPRATRRPATTSARGATSHSVRAFLELLAVYHRAASCAREMELTC